MLILYFYLLIGAIVGGVILYNSLTNLSTLDKLGIYFFILYFWLFIVIYVAYKIYQ